MTTPRTPAPDLTPDQQARVDVFEAAAPAPESFRCACGRDGLPEPWHSDQCLGNAVDEVERMAKILCDTDAGDIGYGWDELAQHGEPSPYGGIRDAYRRLARAALDHLLAPDGAVAELIAEAATKALAPVLALAEELDADGHRFAAIPDPYSAGVGDARIAAAARIRAAAAPEGGTVSGGRRGWLAATCYPVGSLGDYSWSYSWDGRLHATRRAAIKAGLRDFGSDDFNIGYVMSGALVWWGWMDEEHPDDLASAAAGLYLDGAR